MAEQKQPAEQIATAMQYVFISPNEEDRNGEPANVVDGLFAIARALGYVANAIDRLGNGNAATPMGAIEALGLVVKESNARVADALSEIASAIEDK